MRIISMLSVLLQITPITTFAPFPKRLLLSSTRFNFMSTTYLSNSHTHVYSKVHACATLDLNRYITAIQNEVELQHGNGSSRTFRAKLRPQNQKPILRTLLGIPTREAFDEIIRTQTRLIAHERMKQFCASVLQPRVHSLPEYLERGEDYLPYFDIGFQDAIQLSHKGPLAFNRMSSGRRYKGQMLNLLNELCPDLIAEYKDALQPPTEEEMYLHIIDYVASQNNLAIEHVEAAKKCVTLCQKTATDSANGSGMNGEVNENSNLAKTNGLLCEQSCVRWLKNRIRKKDSYVNGDDCESDDGASSSSSSPPFSTDTNLDATCHPIILQNVMVNSYQTKSRPKYHNDTNPDCSWNILWTSSSDRRKICSEFDAVVLQPHSHSPHKVHISEIWEAKTSLSPSSIHDLLNKKLPAIQTILDDEKVTMSLCDENDFYNNISSSDSGGVDTTRRELHQVHKDEKQVTFGIYGMDVLPPENAVGQLRSTAVSYALSSDLDFAMSAVEKGYAEMDLDHILKDLEYLRQKLMDGRTQFNIVAKVALATPAEDAIINTADSTG